MKNQKIQIAIFAAAIILCATGYINAPTALIGGFIFSWLVGHPFKEYNQKATGLLLKISVVGLGFGMNVNASLNASNDGLLLTIISISLTLVLGTLIGLSLKINKRASHLIASGTAICGGSAIAAVAPVVNATEKEISVSLATIFFLNSVALLIFPPIGQYFELTQYQFGLWSAIAIHDTSSVVGAASAYGHEALLIATTVKLARALWIIPVALLSAFIFKSEKKKVNIPWFIGFFVIAMLINSYFPQLASINSGIVTVSKIGLVITLFLIGAGLTIEKLRSIGVKPLLLGIILWIFISVLSLLAVFQL
ncbi:MAG: putative sulfate exporter family transporter [Ignavibacteriae bacterium]|nr:putative sulfate exporter family transporter [Ignavibacteriota bacterium]NOG99400.1 putative sulfate exporter family transporter [Ignavibacteriota bacterium]